MIEQSEPRPRDSLAAATGKPRRWIGWSVAIACALGLAGAGSLWAAGTTSSPRTLDGNAWPTPAPRQGWLKPGPWGRVEARRIDIAPPVRGWAAPRRMLDHDRWVFPYTGPGKMSRELSRLHLSPTRLDHLLSETRSDVKIDGFVITPTPAVVEYLPSPVRARLYDRLAQTILNVTQVNAFRYWGTSVDTWLQGADLSSATYERIEQLTYRNGALVFFADLPMVMPTVARGRRAALRRALSRQATLKLTLRIHHGQHLAPLIRYWGRHGRETQVAAKLTALAAAPHGGWIDVAKLLPPFARRHLYHYPDPVAEPRLAVGQSRDCHWSALNFFNRAADPRFADKTIVTRTLDTQFHEVRRPRFGDLVEFAAGGTIFHSAVYIADGVLFTKNGARATQPWMLLPLSVMKDFYPTAGPVHIVYLRHDHAQTGAESQPGSYRS